VSRSKDPEFYELLVQDDVNDWSTNVGDVENSQHLAAATAMSVITNTLISWRRSVVVSALSSINVVNRHWARLPLG